MMKSQSLDEGRDSIHHVNIDNQVRSVEAQLVEFAKLYTNGDNEHMDFEDGIQNVEQEDPTDKYEQVIGCSQQARSH